MVFQISNLWRLPATASGVDKASKPVQVDVTAYVINVGDLNAAIGIVEAQVLNEAVIPDGAGGFTNPTLVKVIAFDSPTVLTVAPLTYWRGPVENQKFPINSIYEIQVTAFGNDSSVNLSVYPLNSDLEPAIALAKSDVLTFPIVPNPYTSQNDLPDSVVAISAAPVGSAPLTYILVASAVIPNWPDLETVGSGQPGLPAASTLGLNVNFVTVPNDGTHGDYEVKSLRPPAGSEVPVGSLVVVTLWDRNPGE